MPALHTKSDLLALYNYVQLTAISAVKSIIIDSLREFFSSDTYYLFERDQWGFPKIPDHTDTSPKGGIIDTSTTRLLISEPYRYKAIYYPALLVRNAGIKSTPISFNQEREAVVYKSVVYMDGYGNQTSLSTPDYYLLAGAFDGTFTVEIITRSTRARDELCDLLLTYFINYSQINSERSGIFIKPNGISAGSPSEADDRNDKLFKQIISCEYRSEWQRNIPINSFANLINFCLSFGHNIETDHPVIAPNLGISTFIDLMGELQKL